MENLASLIYSQEDQAANEGDEPPDPTPQPAGPWRVAVIANLKGEHPLTSQGPSDAGAEFDKPETIQAIQKAIETDHHTTVFFNADATLPLRLSTMLPDICFNIAEGVGGDAREAQVPALLEMLHIPYTASRVLANAIGLDKTMTKKIWRDAGLPTARFQEFTTGEEALDAQLEFPLFVKPAREGTGMGMDAGSIVHNIDELRARVAWVIQSYQQPALVEEFLPGREFTVAVLGREDALNYTRHSEWYESDGFVRLPVEEVDNSFSATPGVYGNFTKTLHFGEEGIPGFLCPAPISVDMATKLQNLAIKAHQAIGTLDVSRVDIRMDAHGQPRLIEINTLPGLTPDFSDLCVICNAANIKYTDLILEILYLGASRYGLLSLESVPETAVVSFSNRETVPVLRTLQQFE
jgi:D-alanine-D-alanine ligase